MDFTLTAAHSFPAGVPITLAALRKAAVPILASSGSIGEGDIAAGAVTSAKTKPGPHWYAPGTLVAGTYNVTLDPALTALADGAEVAFKAGTTNTGAVSLNVNGLGAKPIWKFGKLALADQDIRENRVVICRYSSALNGGAGVWLMLNPPNNKEVEWVATDSGAANAYAITPDPVYTALSQLTGKILMFKPANTNTGASTLNPNALGAATIKKHGDKDLLPGDIRANVIATVIYDGTNFQLLNPCVAERVAARCVFSGNVQLFTINNTVDTGTERLTVNAHAIPAVTNKSDAQAVIFYEEAGATLPAGLSENTTYWACRVDANTITLHTDPQGAVDGVTGLVNLTGNGAGTNKLAYVVVNSRYNVSGVVPLADTAANAIDTGAHRVHFLQAFSAGSQVTMAGAAKSAGGSTVFVVVRVHESDAAEADRKWIRLVNQAAVGATSSEVHLTFSGLAA